MDAARRAVRDARALRAVVAEQLAQGTVETFDLADGSGRVDGAQGFWFTADREGVSTASMGVVHRVRFPDARIAPDRLAAAVRHDLLPACHWQLADGEARGFRFAPAFALSGDGALLPEPAGDDTESAVMRIDLLDFYSMMMPLRSVARWLGRRFPMGTYAALHADLHEPLTPAGAGDRARASFGWAMVKHRVGPSFFGYGPGQLERAFKSFTFSLTDDGALEVEMVGAMAPRSEKVLNLWGFDPVYRLVDALDWLTLGRLGLRRVARDRLDANMLALHCRVHEAMLRGAVRPWLAGAERV